MDSPHLTSEERLDFLLDQIAPEARPDLYRHLWGCAECSREVLAVLGEVSLDHDLVSQYLGESLWAESAEGPAERRKTLRESLTIGLSEAHAVFTRISASADLSRRPSLVRGAAMAEAGLEDWVLDLRDADADALVRVAVTDRGGTEADVVIVVQDRGVPVAGARVDAADQYGFTLEGADMSTATNSFGVAALVLPPDTYLLRIHTTDCVYEIPLDVTSAED